MSSNANAWRNFSIVSPSTVVSGVSRILKKPKSPLADALAGMLEEDARDDTISVTAGGEHGATGKEIVAACSKVGFSKVSVLAVLVDAAPNKLLEGARSQAGIEGIEGMPTDQLLPVEGSFDEPKAMLPRTSAIDAPVDGGYVWSGMAGVRVGVRLDVEVRREPGPPSIGEVVSLVVTMGTNDEPLFLTMCVNPSLLASGTPLALADRPSGRVCSNEAKRKPDGDLGACSIDGLVGERAVEERPLVVSTTVGEDWEKGTPRYVRTASRICSSAVGRSWK